jgi:pyruvate,water dikinase
MSELKLEEIDLNTDPCNLFIMIKNYMQSGQTDLSAFKRNEKRLRGEAERKIDQHLNGYKKRIYLWVLKHARNSVKNRENLRFARTRVFGLSRKMFRGIGEDLYRKNLLESPSDVFYLMVEELIAFSEGRSTLTNLIGLCKLRKEEFNLYKEKEEPDDRFYTRGVVYSGNAWNKRDVIIEDGLSEDTLKGVPCCPGKATGRAKVILSTKDDLTLSGEILVTARTDPGWVPLFPLISGLLIERGSLLSHSAIVARELGVPTIIKVKNLLDQIHNGDSITMDGSNGIIRRMLNAKT